MLRRYFVSMLSFLIGVPVDASPETERTLEQRVLELEQWKASFKALNEQDVTWVISPAGRDPKDMKNALEIILPDNMVLLPD